MARPSPAARRALLVGGLLLTLTPLSIIAAIAIGRSTGWFRLSQDVLDIVSAGMFFSLVTGLLMLYRRRP